MGLIHRFLALKQSRKTRENYIAVSERLRQYILSASHLKLHFGCGPRVLKGWINIDLSYAPYENYLQYYGEEFYPAIVRGGKADLFKIDVTKERLPIDDNTVDVVFHEDFIEHLDQRSQIIFFAETFRVLKLGCIHRVNTPDLKASMLKNSDFNLGAAGVYLDEWDKHGHKNLLTVEMLTDMAQMTGYREVHFTKRDESLSPLIPREYRPDPNDRDEDGNIFADLVK
jgi:predicted SAM-dependent methyltransferase